MTRSLVDAKTKRHRVPAQRGFHDRPQLWHSKCIAKNVQTTQNDGENLYSCLTFNPCFQILVIGSWFKISILAIEFLEPDLALTCCGRPVLVDHVECKRAAVTAFSFLERSR